MKAADLVALEEAPSPGCCMCAHAPDESDEKGYPTFLTIELDGEVYNFRICSCECAYDLGLKVAPFYVEVVKIARRDTFRNRRREVEP